jgi:hypothetical protein
VEFHFDIGLKAFVGFVVCWERNVLGGEKGDVYAESFAGDCDGRVFGAVALKRVRFSYIQSGTDRQGLWDIIYLEA